MRLHPVVLVAGLFLALAACGSAGRTASAPTTTGSPSATTAGPIAYAKSWDKYGSPKGSVDIAKPSDLTKLTGAPDDFVDFIGEYWASLKGDTGDGPECNTPVISVDGIDPDVGVALGGVGDCGGWEALWIRWNGRWLEETGTQEGWSCVTLEQWRVPKQIAPPTCDAGDGSLRNKLHYGGPGPKAEPSRLHGRRVVYMTTLDPDSHGADGALVDFEHKPSRALKNPPAGFVQLMNGIIDQGCGARVDGIDPSLGLATGSVVDCDEAHASIWIYWNGSWTEAASIDGRWDCDTLKRYRVPADLTGSTCTEWNNKGEEEVVGYGPSAA